MPSRKAPVISAPVPQSKPAIFRPLDLPSLDFSLTAGTDIPSPPATPPLREDATASALEGHPIVRSPTPGGGPLSSHPTSPVGMTMPGTFPSTPTSTELKANRVLGRNPADDDQQAHLPFPREPSAAALPTSPPAAGTTAGSRRSSIIGGGKGGPMRRLFSLRSLYSNSNASRTDCFSGGNGSSQNLQQLHYDAAPPSRLARMSSSDSFAAAHRPASSMANGRPQSRMTDISAAAGDGRTPSLRSRTKRSSTFFGGGAGSARRKSGLFLFGSARVDANGTIPEDAEKENREPPPTIQEVKVDTNIGGEELFRDIK